MFRNVKRIFELVFIPSLIISSTFFNSPKSSKQEGATIDNNHFCINYQKDDRTGGFDDEGIYVGQVQTANFTVKYETGILQTEATLVANYYETLRVSFYSFGFNYPLSNSNDGRYRVGLNNSGGGAFTHWDSHETNPILGYSYTVHRGFSAFTNDFKEQATHEYFHAVQNAHYRNMGWYAEATSQLAAIIVNNTSNTIYGNINDFIEAIGPLDDIDVMYGSVLFPLTLYKKCGGISVILETFNQFASIYNNDASNFDTFMLKNVVDSSLQSLNINESFNTIVRTMYSYMYNTSLWFNSITNTTMWDSVYPINANISTSSQTYKTQTFSIDHLSSKYIVFNFPSTFVGTLEYKITASHIFGSSIWSQQYTKSGGVDTIIYKESGPIISGKIDSLGETTDSFCLIITNVNVLLSNTFSVEYTFYAKQESLSFYNSTRLFEKKIFLNASEEADIQIKFWQSNQIIAQTLSPYDTVVKICSSAGVTIVEDDDSGYDSNGFVTFTPTANVYYSIRVRFYDLSLSGYIRLLINKADRVKENGISYLYEFAGIRHIYNQDNYSFYTYCERFKSQFIRYTPLTTGIHTVQLNSIFDNYLYVLDPDSSKLGVEGLDFSDNGVEGTNNAKITRNMISGKTYLIVFCQKNPGSTFTDLDLGDDITISISMSS